MSIFPRQGTTALAEGRRGDGALRDSAIRHMIETGVQPAQLEWMRDRPGGLPPLLSGPLLARSVERVERGLPPVRVLLRAWRERPAGAVRYPVCGYASGKKPRLHVKMGWHGNGDAAYWLAHTGGADVPDRIASTDAATVRAAADEAALRWGAALLDGADPESLRPPRC